MLASDWLTTAPGPLGRGHESHRLIMNFISVIILIQITFGHDPVSSSLAWKVTHETSTNNELKEKLLLRSLPITFSIKCRGSFIPQNF